MATTMPTTPDTLVTIKINVEGSNRRFKLPLRDLGADTLPEKLRFLLAVPPTHNVMFERYSDSTAMFMVLDPANPSVYKQLYRAAKSKLKLRLRATLLDKQAILAPSIERAVVTPRPASVEDETVENAAEVMPEVAETERPVPADTAQVVEGTAKAEAAVDEIKRRVEALMLGPAITRQSAIETSTQAAGRSSDIPVTKGAAARDRFLAELAGLDRRGLFSNRAAVSAVEPSTYSVYCNKCNSPIPDEHYHCSTCDDGDFDLCKNCIDHGVLCGGEGHWMIKRNITEGKVVNSTTETLPPRVTRGESKSTLFSTMLEEAAAAAAAAASVATRTCNSCIQEFPEENFITCLSCDDFDLCIPCHLKLDHGHHPQHAFAPTSEEAQLAPLAKALLAPGRNASHQAICDGCDKYIYGVRHKCLDCPDWDYCSSCIVNASFIHPRHRFVPIYEPLDDHVSARSVFGHKVRHHGIYCDGPLCNAGAATSTYIQGDRYKCAVCNDLDFCAACEASPSNLHNKTHPLIKFKTPVRNVSVTTMGDHATGPMPPMGDHRRRYCRKSRSTETDAKQSVNAATQVQTVADLKPCDDIKSEAVSAPAEMATIPPSEKNRMQATIADDLIAHFVRDTVQDGTVMPVNTVFEQTWTLRNAGDKAWPAGCSVKFVGGDNMCANDPEHPASVHELVSATESTTCYTEVAPGQEFGFTVLMRTPNRSGKVISYWRLTGPNGLKFGHRLWCDVSVSEPVPAAKKAPFEEPEKQEEKDMPEEVANPSVEETSDEAAEHSQMVFPKLEKESPICSVHEEISVADDRNDADAADLIDVDIEDDVDTEDGFLTDEEYDILDASDEEYLVDQGKSTKN